MRTWDRVPQRMFARKCHTRPDMPTSYKRTMVAFTQEKTAPCIEQDRTLTTT